MNPFNSPPQIHGLGRGIDGGTRKQAAPPGAAVPPDIPNIILWFDAGDPSSIWRDDAGTIPPVDGLDVIRLDNKGSFASVPFIHDAQIIGSVSPIYLLDEPAINTGSLGIKTGGNSWSVNVTFLGAPAAAPPGGMSMVAVGRQNDIAFVTTTQAGWAGVHALDNDGDNSGNWLVNTHSGSIIDTLVASPVNTWNYAYWAHDAGTDVKFRVGGSAEQSAVTSVWNPINAGQNMGFGAFRGQWAEWIVWTGQLSLANRIALVAYLDTKYGVLPF